MTVPLAVAKKIQNAEQNNESFKQHILPLIFDERKAERTKLRGKRFRRPPLGQGLLLLACLLWLVTSPTNFQIAEVDLRQTHHTHPARQVTRQTPQDGKSSVRVRSCEEKAIWERLSRRKKLRKGSEAQIADSGS